jgi:hypothetical protein
MSEFTNISAALDKHLSEMAGLPDVAWENKDYEPTQGTSYLRPTILPAETFQASLGTNGQDEHTGIYQVDVMVEAGKGKKAGYALADLVADQFARGTDLVYSGVTVTIRQTSRQTGATDNGWFVVPVEIDYQSFTQPR